VVAVSTHSPIPVQAPSHPAKVAPTGGSAWSVTCDPAVTLKNHPNVRLFVGCVTTNLPGSITAVTLPPVTFPSFWICRRVVGDPISSRG